MSEGEVVHGWSYFGSDSHCGSPQCERKAVLTRDSGQRLHTDAGDVIGLVAGWCVEHYGTADQVQARVEEFLEVLTERLRIIQELQPNPFKQRAVAERLGIGQ